MLYNGVLVSAVEQSKSAIWIHVIPPSWPFHPPSPLSNAQTGGKGGEQQQYNEKSPQWIIIVWMIICNSNVKMVLKEKLQSEKPNCSLHSLKI